MGDSMSSLSKKFLGSNANPEPNSATTDFIEQVRVNQKLTTALKPRYDCIVCGSGSYGFCPNNKNLSSGDYMADHYCPVVAFSYRRNCL